ncbi:ABC transporter substrate-binding protein [Paenibacillus sp. NPDC056579]|uniref:ABC transporter substrate-binding protein n=1 Tax=Paenibacillus sp. NPDC056579 TaxID=3345871 RepID=UPI0036CB0E97
MKHKSWKLVLAYTCLSTVLAACGSGSEGAAGSGKASQEAANQPAKQEELKPVTIRLFPNQQVTDADFKKLIADPVKKKYPHITVEMVAKDSAKWLPDYVASGEIMDLVTIWNGTLPSYEDLGLYEDITPLAKKFNLDLSRFDQGALDTIREVAPNKELYALPYGVQINALYYNKDIFDKFGVPYPKDGMTWDDAMELSKKLTREENGIAYRGLDPESLTRMLFPMSLNVVDNKTQKSSVNTEPYKRVFDVTNRIYSLPGNKPKTLTQNAADVFIKEKNVAMLATVNMFDKLRTDPGFQWDVAQYPSYSERPNTFGMFDLHTIFITKTSKHKDDAMRVLEVLFSDEVQMISTKETGRVSPLKDPKFNQAFGADMPHLKGKSLQSIFKSKPAQSPPFSMFYTKGIALLRNSFAEVADGKKDVNTALREADEKINQMIETDKKK